MICFTQVVVLSVYFKNFLKQIIRLYSTTLNGLRAYTERDSQRNSIIRVATRHTQLGRTNNDDTK